MHLHSHGVGAAQTHAANMAAPWKVGGTAISRTHRRARGTTTRVIGRRPIAAANPAGKFFLSTRRLRPQALAILPAGSDRAHSMIVVRQCTRRSSDAYPPAAECTVQRLSQMTMSPTFHLCRYSALG